MSDRPRLALRATLAFLALPGVVAFAVPIMVFGPDGETASLAPWALPLLLLGAGVLGWCVRAAYTIALLVAFQLRVLLHEEPWLARTFGAEWEEYRASVPRWLAGPRR